MKKILFLIVFISCSFLVFSREGGNLLLQAGIGGSTISYGDELDDNINNAVNEYDAERISVYLDLLLGYALADYTYLTFSINGTGDRLESSYSSNSIQFNTYLFSLGFRHFPFKTGLFFGGDIGMASMVIQGSNSYSTGSLTTHDEGFGGAIKLGYDFDTNYKGPSLSLTGAINYLNLKGDEYTPDLEVTSASIFVALNFR